MGQSLYTRAAALLLIVDAKAKFATGKLKLFQAPGTIDAAILIADLTECDFSGYTAITFTVTNAPYNGPQGGATYLTTDAQFDFDGAADPPVPNTVLGWWIESSAGKLLAVGLFTNPIAMQAGGNSIPIQIGFTLYADDLIQVFVPNSPQ